jgi:hypothetical protein
MRPVVNKVTTGDLLRTACVGVVGAACSKSFTAINLVTTVALRSHRESEVAAPVA